MQLLMSVSLAFSHMGVQQLLEKIIVPFFIVPFFYPINMALKSQKILKIFWEGLYLHLVSPN